MIDVNAYRCYYCKELLDAAEASIHFGDHGDSKPICIIQGSTAHGLAVRVRELEKDIAEFRSETDPVSRYWYDLQSKHHREVREAEESGYAKGLADAKKESDRGK